MPPLANEIQIEIDQKSKRNAALREMRNTKQFQKKSRTDRYMKKKTNINENEKTNDYRDKYDKLLPELSVEENTEDDNEQGISYPSATYSPITEKFSMFSELNTSPTAKNHRFVVTIKKRRSARRRTKT